MSFIRLSVIVVGVLFSVCVHAQANGLNLQSLNGANSFPPPEEVFILDYQQIDHELTVSFQIPEGFYLYQERFNLTPEEKVAGEIELPEGIAYEDQFFGSTVIYRDQVSFNVSLNQARRNEPLTVHYQGCADEGFCYPPSTQTIFLRQTNGVNGTAAINTETSNPGNGNYSWVFLIIVLAVGLLALFIIRKKQQS
ncbi:MULTISPECIES: protein-disulfide reductase DsbD domain-containing protein [Gammaproteobacteria]|uniref:protein-disulfide reductase DsbD domain-containing protein n=1 Tax=Gammaproteobacteria TaxID=1236 RepID=UPI000DCF788D|nr:MULTISPECIES: protein-disulfide reductase DsbD domain-containing protein [Gammaproteobacteria]RTE85689.1 hypothetical protein DQX04_09550 [Aliidiomarina sp. B3213]TCZ90310.1 hypothetical protein EYQ95_10910 [Lysobacter sp. N42]